MERRKLIRTFAALFVATATARLGLGIIAPILPLYAETFSATGLEIGLVFAAFSVSRAILGPFVGRLSDQIGRKPLIVIGLAGYALVSVLYAGAGSLWELGVYRFLQGVAAVLVTPIAQAYVGDLTPKGKEGRYANLFYAAQFVGLAIGPLLGGGIGAAWSYAAAFYVMGGLTLVALILVIATVPADRTLSKAIQTARERIRRGAFSEMRTAFGVVLRNDAVKAIFAYVGTRGFWRSSFTTFYPLFAAATLGASEADVGVVLSAYMFAEAFAQVPAGFLADRFPRVRQIVVASVLAPLGLLVIPFFDSTGPIVGAAVFMGAFSALGRASL
ncbi:MFS transporter, partial [Candidatus Bipolaricaulota bacterium]|nr:MFS transporter [Candidatus Bipolaricaulota bacterium]